MDDTPQVTVEKLQQILRQLHKSEEWTSVHNLVYFLYVYNFPLPTKMLEIKSNKFCKKIKCNKSMLIYFNISVS